MPEIQDINDFKNDLLRLGNEPEIREQRGESLPNISVPETQSVEDLSALFDDDTVDGSDDLDEAALFGAEDPEADFSEGETDIEESEDSSEDLFGDMDDESDALDSFPADDLSEDDFNLPEGLTEGFADDIADDSGDVTDSIDEDDFSLPEGLTAGLSEDLDTQEPDVQDEEDIFSDFDDIGEDGFDMEDALPEVEESEALEASEEAPLDDFDTSDFDLEDFAAVEEFNDDALEDEPLDDDIFGEEGSAEDLFGEEPAEVVEEPADIEPAEAPDDEDLPSDDFDLDSFDISELDDDDQDLEPIGDLDADEFVPDESEEVGIDDFSMDDLASDDFSDDVSNSFGDEELGGFEDDESESSFESDDSEIDDFSDGDMFDTSELDAPGFDSDDVGAGDIEGDDDFSLEDFSLGEIDGDDIEASEFSLGDLGDEFGVDDEEEESGFGHLEGLDESPTDFSEDFGDAYSDDTYAIPDDEYIELKKTLGMLPRNLKLIIEELIGEKNLSGENLDKLVQSLIRGASAKEVGAIVSKVTGKKIKIPAQYERRTAEEFEKEKDSFGYIFRKNFIPMFRTAAIAAVLLGLLLFFGFRFVYTPLHAESLYKKGYEEIYTGNNQQANAYFGRAFNEWQKKTWFYRYAEGFAEQKQYILAEEKYEQLLDWYPEERDAVLDYAELEFKTLGKYPEAEKLLNDLLFDELRDYDARLMLADTYMEWAQEIDPAKYEDARFNYAKLLEQYGSRDELLFRMLRYFIRTGNHREAMNLYEAFRQNDKAAVEPDIYAELAGYLIDNDHLEDVREILMKAKSIDDTIPEIHYQLSRYFKMINIPGEEEKALNAAIWLFEQTSPLTRTRNGMLIDSYNRNGMVLYNQERFLDAEEYFQKAAANYDESLAAGQISPEPKYGNIFSNLGDLAYYISGDYEQALRYYEKSELNEYSPPILKYKKGYIYYNNEDFREALVEFYDTAGGFSTDRGLMYSTANTLFNRNDYYLAEGLYTHLLDMLNKEYSSINYLLIDEIPEHRALLENMMKVSNNLGVTKNRLYERTRDPEKNAEAMVLLTDSVEYYDKLSRDPESLVEPDSVNLSYLNSRAVFYPVPDYRLQIYQDIPKDLDKINF